MSKQALPVNEVFETIQGEGFHTGVAAVFIRLQGCDVGCPWCDTKHTWNVSPSDQVGSEQIIGVSGDTARWSGFSAQQLSDLLSRYNAKHIVITGGEPAMYDLNELTGLLIEAGYSVQLESSGTYPIRVAPETWVTVSPKVAMQGGKAVLAEALERANEIKHPVARKRDIDNLQALLECMNIKQRPLICLQPISQQARATQLCIDACIANNWRLSLQTHKYIGIE